MGWAGLLGIAMVFCHTLIIIFLGKFNTSLRIKQAKFSDSRMKMITNLIEGIRIVKLYGWEKPFVKLIKL